MTGYHRFCYRHVSGGPHGEQLEALLQTWPWASRSLWMRIAAGKRNWKNWKKKWKSACGLQQTQPLNGRHLARSWGSLVSERFFSHKEINQKNQNPQQNYSGWDCSLLTRTRELLVVCVNSSLLFARLAASLILFTLCCFLSGTALDFSDQISNRSLPPEAMSLPASVRWVSLTCIIGASITRPPYGFLRRYGALSHSLGIGLVSYSLSVWLLIRKFD